MSNDPLAKVFPLVIGEKTFNLSYTMEAEYLIGTLPEPFLISDIKVRKKSWSALVAWFWAMLPDEERAPYPKPQKLAHLLKDDGVIKVAMAAVIAAYLYGTKDEPKNAKG